MGGGGGGGRQDPQMYRQEENKIMYARASASEIYVFSDLKLHLHIYTMQ